jgi:CxxC motif-containing protein
MSQGQGSISSNELMKKLVQAKKVMNKVDGGNFERGHVNESMLLSDPEELMKSQYGEQQPQPNQRPVNGQASVDKIQNSKLPDAIKRAMIESPIPQISLNDTLDMDFVKGAKRLMEQEGVSSKKPQPQQKQSQVQSSNIDMNAIALMIENTVRKVMDEKLNQILTASTTSSINENLVLKVGDSIFKGKITGVNKAK